ncbi:MAG: hypothetical protein WDZ35_06725 [Crocinitomicaceae bacterium]
MTGKTKITLISSVLLISFLFLSCFKSEKFPDQPIISNAQAEVMGDSALISFDFTDGDADLGLSPSDTFGVFAPDSFYYNNIYLDYFEKDDELGWVNGVNFSGDPVHFGYRIKPIPVSEKTEGIKGRIDVFVVPQYRNKLSPESDTVKFEITLIDRALNVSNKIETPALIAN